MLSSQPRRSYALFFTLLCVFGLAVECRRNGQMKHHRNMGGSSPLNSSHSKFAKVHNVPAQTVNAAPTITPEWRTEEVMISARSQRYQAAASFFDLSGTRSVVVDAENRIHVIFCEELDAKFFKGKLMYSSSDDEGVTWSGPREILKTSGPSSPQLTIGSQDNALYVAYLDRKDQSVRLFVSKSDNAGESWDQPTMVVENDDSIDAFYPTIQVDDLSRIHLTWHEADRADESPRTSNVYYTRSTDGGIEFDVPTRLNTVKSASAFSRFTLGGSTGSILATAWSDFRNGQWDLMIARSTDAGVSWEEVEVFPQHDGADFNPDLLVTVTGDLHIVWHNSVVQQNMPLSYVLYASSADFGETWTQPRLLSTDQGRFPQWAVKPDSSAFAVFWLDEKFFGVNEICPLPERCSDVALAYSVDGGAEWESIEFVQFEGHQSILHHSAAFFPDGRPVVVWSMQNNDAGAQRVYTKVRKTPLPF